MNRVILKELNFNNRTVIFNRGENYIVGGHGWGKTTLFYLIQYILGIIKSMPVNSELFINEFLSLEIHFGNRDVTIIREIGKNSIVFKGDINLEAKSLSPELGNIYNKLLEPNINDKEDPMSAIEILKLSFFHDLNQYKTKYIKDSFMKTIGIDIQLPQQIKKELSKFKNKIEFEDKSNKVIKQYINKVNEKILDYPNNGLTKESIKSINIILEDEYKSFKDDLQDDIELYNEASKSFEEITCRNEELFKNRIRIIQQYFLELISKFNIKNKIILDDIIKSNSLMLQSTSEQIIITLCLFITLCHMSKYEWYNGSGFFVNDGMNELFDKSIMYNIRNIVSDECNLGNLQYIEFVNNKKNIPSDAIILELDR